ncbi:CPED1 [Cordylochernes scorpioides]|uniref:CPED1 n=1 Tax=Cordylochernes scorpioides TaxID=51811 RepID=A0ABY6KNA2_9ARAC|nr:CPED1 [Cordylochernes scorpioides]
MIERPARRIERPVEWLDGVARRIERPVEWLDGVARRIERPVEWSNRRWRVFGRQIPAIWGVHVRNMFDDNVEEFVDKNLVFRQPSALPYLSNLLTDPPLQLQPAFSPHVTSYRATVEYDRLLLAVGGRARHCQVEVRLDDRFGPSRMTNYSLGVGENRLTLLLVDVRHTEPWVVNSYSLELYRAPLGSPVPFHPGIPHQLCALTQYKLPPLDLLTASKWQGVTLDRNATCKCRPQRSAHSTATGQLRAGQTSKTKSCSCPCAKLETLQCLVLGARDRGSCFWTNATWQPHSCRHRVLDRASLEECLAGKKLLFVGDSTNRGMMHYLMERLNGSLTSSDKTHHIRLYPDLNRGRTFIGFSYYPQFWLPTNQRPVFDKALYQLIQRSRPLANDTSTVLVVGGVHWLATQHLHMLLRALKV